MLSVTPRTPPPSDPAGPYRVCLGDRERVLALPDVTFIRLVERGANADADADADAEEIRNFLAADTSREAENGPSGH